MQKVILMYLHVFADMLLCKQPPVCCNFYIFRFFFLLYRVLHTFECCKSFFAYKCYLSLTYSPTFWSTRIWKFWFKDFEIFALKTFTAVFVIFRGFRKIVSSPMNLLFSTFSYYFQREYPKLKFVVTAFKIYFWFLLMIAKYQIMDFSAFKMTFQDTKTRVTTIKQ